MQPSELKQGKRERDRIFVLEVVGSSCFFLLFVAFNVSTSQKKSRRKEKIQVNTREFQNRQEGLENESEKIRYQKREKKITTQD